MAATEQPLTRTDFDRCRWQNVIADAAQKDCFTYSQLFHAELKRAEADNDPVAVGVYTVLVVVTQVALRENDTDPFAPRFVRVSMRSASADDLTAEQYQILTELALDVVDAEMRARICDLVWVMRRKPYPLAKAAVSAYLASARTWEHPERWTHCVDRLTRAVRLARSLGEGGKTEFDAVIAYAEEILVRHNGDDPLFLSARVMQLLQEFRPGDCVRYAALAEKCATRAEDEGGSAFDRAKTYRQIAATWYTLAGDTSSRERALLLAAETHVRWSEEAAQRPRENMPHITAASHLQMAYHALQKIGTPCAQRRAEEVYRSLVEAQKRSTSDLLTFRDSIDLTDLARAAEGTVSGKPLTEALMALATLANPQPTQRLREQVRRLVDDPLLSLFSRVIVSTTGKIEATTAHFDSSAEGGELATTAEMHRHAVHCYRVTAAGAIYPALLKIRQEHRVREQDFYHLASQSYFVPRGREMIFAKGLYAGYIGELIVSTHLLIPQIEQSIRMHLDLRGAITSGFDRAQQRQNEYSLDTTLSMSELEQVYDKDTIFALRGLLVEHYGSNLRNLMAHGLLSDQEFQSDELLYLWALTLRLCMATHPPPVCSPTGAAQSVSGQ